MTVNPRPKSRQEVKEEIISNALEKMNLGILVEGVQEINDVTYYRVISIHSDDGYVNRRYSDFEWLHQQLTAFTNGRIALPPLPPKTAGKAMSETVVERVFQFEKFMKFCQADEELKESRVLKHFLTGSVLNKTVQFDVQPAKTLKTSMKAFKIQDPYDGIGDEKL